MNKKTSPKKKRKISFSKYFQSSRLGLLVVVTVVAIVGVVASRQVFAAEPSYITIYFGRSGWQEVDTSCNPIPGTVPLSTVADGLKKRGLAGVGGLVMDYTGETERKCDPWYSAQGVQQGQALYTSWADAANLRDNYGWNFVSQSKSYTWITKFTTDAERRAESCDTLETLRAHGHLRSQGMFAYANNQMDAASDAVVTSCFNFTRKYGPSINTKTNSMTYPHRLSTRSVSGGQCNNPDLPCYTVSVVNNRRYNLPSSLATSMRPTAGKYAMIQFYRFVEGASTGPDLTWDCTSTDPRNHFTSAPELYCLNDFFKAVDGRNKTSKVTDPETVAKFWGRPY